MSDCCAQHGPPKEVVQFYYVDPESMMLKTAMMGKETHRLIIYTIRRMKERAERKRKDRHRRQRRRRKKLK